MRKIWSAWVIACWGSLLFLTTALSQEHPAIALVTLDEETARIFESDPPSALDYAVFLLNLKAHEPHTLAVVPLWQWPGADPAAIEVLNKQTADLNILYTALLDNETEVEDLAPWLRSFPTELQVIGDRSALPRFKSVARLPEPSLLQDANAGFVHVDFGVDARVTEEGILVPLVAMGPNEEVVPALPLALAVEALEIPWKSVKLTPGESLKFGEEMPPIKIDAAGQLRVPLDRPEDLPVLSGESLLSSGEFTNDSASPIKDAVIVFGDDRSEAKLFALPNGERLSRAELVARSAQHLLTASVSEPEPEPVIESLPAKPVPKPKKVVRGPVPYQFPDLRALNVGAWILGIAWGLVFGLVLLLQPTKRSAAPSETPLPAPEPPKPPDPKRDEKPDPVEKKSKPEKKPDPDKKVDPENKVDSENSAHLAQKKRARKRRRPRKRR